ncbi:MAG: Inner membrane protein YjdF [Flavobacteriales bacterium]|nr:Inner membrane protein YjdF [Flavobacteriales bacterium]
MRDHQMRTTMRRAAGAHEPGRSFGYLGAMPFTTASSPARVPFAANPLLKALAAGFVLVWAWTFIGTSDRANWITENALTILFVGGLALTHRRFRFSDLSYMLMFVYILLHVYGAMYTYAENPLGHWLQGLFGSARNHYDRIVHFSFGFLLAYPMRDYFKNHFQWPAWVCWVLPVEITMSFSAAYELIEWAVADVFFPAQGHAYLGTQGDIWDAQKDMALAFSGAVLAMLLWSTAKRMMRR